MSKSAPRTFRLRPAYALLAFPLFLLTACEAFNKADANKPALPPEPAGLTACTDRAVPALPGTPGTAWSDLETPGIIGDQRSAALAKDRCAHDWRSFYADLRSRLAK